MKTGKLKRISSSTLAIFLAVIMAITFGWGSSLQKVYAEDGDEGGEGDIGIVVDWSAERLYSDGDIVGDISLIDDGTFGDCEFSAVVGIIDQDKMGLAPQDDSYINEWDEVFTNGVEYSFNAETKKLVLHGDKIWSKVKDMDAPYVAYWVRAQNPVTGVCTDNENTIDVFEATIDYELHEDTEMLLWTSEEISEELSVEICNAEYPNGKSDTCEVTNVTSSAPAIVSVEKTDEGWLFSAKAKGEATLTITYKDLDGTTKTHQFEVTVVDEEVGVSIELVDGLYQARPGKTIELKAVVEHFYVDENGDYVEYVDKDATFAWSIDEGYGIDFATVTPNASDPSLATVQFDNEEPEDGSEEAVVWVELTTKGVNGDTVVRKDYADGIYKTSDFYQLTPAVIDPDLEVGESITIKPVMKHFSIENPNGVVINNSKIDYTWAIDDGGGDNNDISEVLEITGNKTDGFKIKRLTEEWLGFTLRYEGTDENGEEFGDCIYYYLSSLDESGPEDPGQDDPIDVGVVINWENDELFSDSDLTGEISLEGDEVNDYTLSAAVGINDRDREDYEIDENYLNTWTDVFTEGVEYDFDSDAGTIVLHGDKIWDRVKDMKNPYVSFWVRAEGDEWCSDKEGSFDVYEATVDYGFEDDEIVLTDYEVIWDPIEARAHNSDYPNVEYIDCDIISVESSNPSIVKVERYNDNGDQGWKYTALKKGVVTITVTHKDIYGEEMESTFEVKVVDETLEVVIESWYFQALPGESLELQADATHYVYEDNEIVEGDIDSYNWYIDDSTKDSATIKQDPKDPSKATLTFNAMPASAEYYYEEVTVCVEVTATTKDGQKLEAESEDDFSASSEFDTVFPKTIEPKDLEVGKSVTVTPSVKVVSVDNPNGVAITQKVDYEWNYDDEALKITKNKDGSYTIKRLEAYETWFSLDADWTDEEGDRVGTYRSYSFDSVEEEEPGDLEPQEIEVDPEMTIAINAKGKYEPQQIVIENADELVGDITYKTSNKKIATVSNTGLVKGIKAGEATITVSVAGDRTHAPATAEIDVVVPTKISSFALNKTSFTYDGEDKIPTITKINKKKAAKFEEGEDYEIEIIGDTINAGSYQFIVRGIGKYAGEVKKTIKIAKAKQTITVETPQMVIGDVVNLDPAADETEEFTYKSSSKKIATVDEDGNVTALKSGKVKITITAKECANYKKATKTIKIKIAKKPQGLTVEEVGEVTVGDEFYLDVYADEFASAPKVAAADKKSKKIVKVDKDGKITALKAGTAKIKVSVAGNSIYATETVIVPITVVAPIVPLDPDTPEPTGEEVVVDPVVPEPTL